MKILLLNQCFWPDVVATSQQLTAVARRLSARGHDVTVIAGRQGYDDPKLVFPRHERWSGIDIIRIPSLNLGKKRRFARTVNFAVFMFMSGVRLLNLPRQDVVVALTSPPLISWLAAAFTRLKGGEMIFWAMDLNPDEAIAAGWLKENSFAARFLSRLLRSSMRQASAIIALDHFMKLRIMKKGIAEAKISVIPPARDENARFDERGREAFRRQHNLDKKFVVMYAGNHSPCHPLDTLLESAKHFRENERIVFLFVGGGSEQNKVEAFALNHRLTNIKCLPYQAQRDLAAVLSAADLQIVVMGDAFVGIVHPSKVYNILAVGAPFVFIGPDRSPLAEIVARIGDPQLATHVSHGESDKLARIISAAANYVPVRLAQSLELDAVDSSTGLIALIESASPEPQRPIVESAVPASRPDFIA
jgi:glycosyltransferase involved in cell wall biosynthesis